MALALAAPGHGPAVPAAVADAAPPCPGGFGLEANIGCARTLPNGNRLVHHRVGGDTEIHGTDPADGATGSGQALEALAPERPVACAASGSRSVAIYAYLPDSPNRVDTVRPAIQSAVRATNGLLASEAVETGVIADYRFACESPGFPSVWPLATTAADFSSVVSAARTNGMTSPTEDYWIFADFPSPDGRVAGTGTFYADETLSPSNLNHRRAGYAVTYAGFWGGRTPMHENGHNMGAVQDSAPDSSGAAHCDGGADVDIMCYNDEGPTWDPTQECGAVARVHYDACHNDFFNTLPPAGSYLASNHNIGANMSWAGFDNPFLAFGPPTANARYNALDPARILDTRSGNGAAAGKLGPQTTLGLQVTGRGGVPATGVSAVVVNLTVTDPSASGYLLAWPAGLDPPVASNLNFSAGQTAANLAVVKIGRGGVVNLYNAAGESHVVVDVVGWHSDGLEGVGGGFRGLSPGRILDTRYGNGAPAGKLGPQATLGLQVTGRGGVPATGVSAVVVNLTVTDPSAASYLAAWPAGAALPLASNLNFAAGQTVPNLAVVKVGTGGVVNLYNWSGETHVVADVVGWYSGAPGAGEGAGYVALPPSRILDTRFGNGAPAGKLGPQATLGLQVTGRGGVPATGVSAVALNLTVTGPSASSYLTAWPAGVPLPLASNLNFTAGQTVANLAVVKVGSGGFVDLYNRVGETHVVADVVGWYGE